MLCVPSRVSAKVMSPDVPVTPLVRMDVAAPKDTSSLNITADPLRPPVAVKVPFKVMVLPLPESMEIRPASFPAPAEVLMSATLILPAVVIVTSPPSCWEIPVFPRVSIKPVAVMSPVVANKLRSTPGPSKSGVVTILVCRFRLPVVRISVPPNRIELPTIDKEANGVPTVPTFPTKVTNPLAWIDIPTAGPAT